MFLEPSFLKGHLLVFLDFIEAVKVSFGEHLQGDAYLTVFTKIKKKKKAGTSRNQCLICSGS